MSNVLSPHAFSLSITAISSPDLTGDLWDKAFVRTRETLKKLDEIRHGLELPREQLPIVIEMFAQAANGLLAEKQREAMAARTKRLPMSIISRDERGRPVKIPPNITAQVTVRPQWIAYRVEDISIVGDRTRWIVDDVQVGMRSQNVTGGSIPGAEFGPGGVLSKVRLETCQTAMDFTLIVRYVGPEPEGEAFEATAVGLAFEAASDL